MGSARPLRSGIKSTWGRRRQACEMWSASRKPAETSRALRLLPGETGPAVIITLRQRAQEGLKDSLPGVPRLPRCSTRGPGASRP
jgi:hypothetical protein